MRLTPMLHSSSNKWIQRQLVRDHMLAITTPYLRLSLVNATNSIEIGRSKFHLTNALMTNLYSKVLLSTTLLSSFLKGEERVIVQAMTNNENHDPVARIYGEVTMGEIRGFLHTTSHPSDAPDMSLSSSFSSSSSSSASLPASYPSPWNGKLSSGFLQVSRILYGEATPVQSIIPLNDGDIENDLRFYFAQSEQIPTILRLETSAQENSPHTVNHAFGLIIQRIATSGGKTSLQTSKGIPWTTYEQLRNKVEKDTSFSLLAYHQQNKPLIDVAKYLVPELVSVDTEDLLRGKGDNTTTDPSLRPIVRRIPLDFFCRCTKDRFLRNLARLGETIVKELEEDYGKQYPEKERKENDTITSLTCQFCNNQYGVERKDLETIRQMIHQQEQSPSPS